MFYIFIFGLGLIIGSFLNVVVLRMHSGESIVKSRSHCPQCHHLLSPIDLVPVFSFLFQFGKCRYCQKKIAWQYPLVEGITALLFLAFFIVNLNKFSIPVNFQFSIFNFQTFFSIFNLQFILLVIRDWVFVCFLIVIFVYDYKWYLILDRITIPAMIVALVFNLFLGYSLINLLWAVVIGFGFFALQFVVSGGKWIGGGDLRLGVLMGLMLGLKSVVVALFMSYVLGSVISILLVIWGTKKLKSQIPFGTFLAIGTVLALLWGERIANWYLNLM